MGSLSIGRANTRRVSSCQSCRDGAAKLSALPAALAKFDRNDTISLAARPSLLGLAGAGGVGDGASVLVAIDIATGFGALSPITHAHTHTRAIFFFSLFLSFFFLF
jgi:hypothetical protein